MSNRCRPKPDIPWNGDMTCHGKSSTHEPGGEQHYEEMRTRYMERLDKPTKKSKKEALNPAMADFINADASVNNSITSITNASKAGHTSGNLGDSCW
jgi:hypothetical protein